jgi:general secretion pathway protein I
MTRRRRGGFTLLEVMIALAVLGGALVVLLRISSQDVRAAYRAKLLTIGTSLARSKMYDLEEELVKNGFADSPEEESGDFTDESQPKFRWQAAIEKVQLPQTDQLAGDASKDKAKPPPSPTDTANQDKLLELTGGSTTGALGASMVQMYLPLIGPILENAIRKVTLTVTWKIGDEEEALKVVCFFTDTKAISLAGAAADAAAAVRSNTGAGGGGGGGGGGGSGAKK